jgi:hypothetical protein
VQIQLTLPALERLIAGDNEIEVGIRRQICEEFTKKHLKQIINDESFKAIVKAWDAELKQALGEKLAELVDRKRQEVAGSRFGESIEYWNFKKPIAEAASRAVDAAIASQMKNEEITIGRLVRRAVAAEMEKQVDAALAERVKDRTSELGKLIEEEVEARIQERLKAAATIKE